MKIVDTRKRLLDAATLLIAEHGFSGTSVRMIAARARANVAAISFHFGSKRRLFEEVLRRGLESLLQTRLDALAAIRATTSGRTPRLDQLLHVFVDPLFTLSTSKGPVDRAFMRILAKTLVERNTHYARLMKEDLAEAYAPFRRAFGQALPELNAEELGNRLDFVIGVVGHALADSSRREAFMSPTKAANLERLRPQLFAFLVGGLSALATLPKR